jgi:hypothetical protein
VKTIKTALVALAFLITFVSSALAQTMSNDDYKIRMGNLNSVAGKSTGDQKLNITVGQTGPGLYSGPNYKVRAGFQYISSIIPFRFSVSDVAVALGTLTPNNPIFRTAILTVSNQSAGGYSVTLSQNHQLLVPASGAIIGDTTCDGGTCSETTAAAWTSSVVYGWGYRCDLVSGSNYCVSDFSSADNYKQFADLSKNESAQTVMTGATGRSQQAQITYKVNISASQFAGFYTNVVSYIATPTY